MMPVQNQALPASRAVRGMVESGERLRSRSGRAMSPVPRLTMGTDRALLNTLARLHAWLLAEAIEEARVQGPAFHQTLLRGMNARRLSPSDLDTLNLMLFDHENGPGFDHRTVPATSPAA